MATTLDDLQSTSFSTVPEIKSIEALQAENANLTAAENEQIKNNPALEASLKNLQAERYDRIERQKKYNSLLLSGQAQMAIESLPLKAQKNDAIKAAETDFDYKDASEDTLIYVQEEKALMDAQRTGGNYLLTVKFAVQESRAQRQVQINGMKKYYSQKEQEDKSKLETLLSNTDKARFERNEKYRKFVIEYVLRYNSQANVSYYGLPSTEWVKLHSYLTAQEIANYRAATGRTQVNIPFSQTRFAGVKNAREFIYYPKDAYGKAYAKTIVGAPIWDLLDSLKDVVLRNPHEFLNTIKESDSTFNTIANSTANLRYPANGIRFLGSKEYKSLDFGETEYLIKALLDECFPFYADVKSGVKKYPFIIDYGENVPFPTPDQAYAGFKKLLRLGSNLWAEGVFTVMKKIAEVNSASDTNSNLVIAFPKTSEYYSRYSDFSANQNPIIPKPNPAFKRSKQFEMAYNLTPQQAERHTEAVIKGENVQKLYAARQITEAQRNSMNAAIQAQYGDTYALVNAASKQGYNFNRLNNPAFASSWAGIFQPGGESFFEEMSNNDIQDYYSIRPQSGFLYVPKIGYINPYFATFIPTVEVTSPMATEAQRRANLERQARAQANLSMFKNLVKGMATGNFTQIMAVIMPDSKFAKAFTKLDALTGGLITSVQMFGQTTIKAVQGAHISREETMNALMVMAKVGILVASGGSAASVIGAVSSQLSQGTLGESAFGKAVLSLGSVLAVSSYAKVTLEQALTQQVERELKSVATKEIAKETKLDKSVIGIVAVSALVETSTSAALGRDWEKTLIEAAKKGSMQVAATLVPGGHLLLEAAFKVYDKGWDSMLPKGFDLGAIENPITALERVDWKDVGKNILNGLKNQQNKQIIALIATGRMKPEDIARGVFVQKLTEDLAKKTAMTEYARNPNDPGVKAATEMLATVHLEQRRHAVAEKIGRGERLTKDELRLLEPAGEVYLNMLKEIVPDVQVTSALQTALKIGMPDIKNYLSMEGPDLRIDWPFKIPTMNLMSLGIDISKLSLNGLSLPEFQSKGLSVPGFGKIPSPDQLTLFDLPKLGVKIDLPELEKIVKITLPKGVDLKPRIPMEVGGEIPNETRIIDTDLNVDIRGRLGFSPYEHPMLKYGYVERKLTRQQELYNMMRTIELKEAMLKLDEGNLALAQMTNNTTLV